MKIRVSLKSSFACFLLSFSLFIGNRSLAQTSIYEIMERTDLRIDEVEKLATAYFNKVGTDRGSGYKMYCRWLYERKFHLDENGFYINPQTELSNYQSFTAGQKKSKASSISWTELGPKSWTFTSGWNPGVGEVTSIAVCQSDTSLLYVGSASGGVWKSTNGGGSWNPVFDFASNSWLNVSSVCLDPNDPNVVYVAANTVLKSKTAGHEWFNTGNGPSSPKKVIVNPKNSNNVFVVGAYGIWRSTNAGTSWVRVNANSFEDIEFNPYNPNIIYASGPTGTYCVYRSTDNGQTWTGLGSGSGITATGRTMIGVSPANPAVVYILQSSGSIFGKLYKSTDSGATYTTVITGNASAGTNYFGYDVAGKGTVGQSGHDMAICVNPKNINELHIGAIICWKSTNGGASFTPETEWSYPNSTGYNHPDIQDLQWVGNTIYSASDGGIYKTVNHGDDWTDLSTGLGIRQLYRIACSKTDPNIIVAGGQDNGTSVRQSSGNWIDWLGGDGMDCIISPTNPDIIMGTCQNGAILKSTNGGASRINLTQPATGNWVTPLVMHPTNHDTIYGGWTGIWKSSNGGSNWTNISSGVITGKIDALAVAPSNTKYIYGSVGTTLYRTSSGGSSWTSVTVPAAITSIFVSQSNPQKIWITCNSATYRVFVSTNMGTNFTDLSSGLPALAARSIVVENKSSEGIYLGMNIGVYYRDNSNPTWVQHGAGLPVVTVNELEIQESSGKLRLATYGRGVWESDLQNKVLCDYPINLQSTPTGNTSTRLSWNAVKNAVSYTFEYCETGSSIWKGNTTTTDTVVNLSNLSLNTAYTWRVKTNCNGNISAFSAASFTLIKSCPLVSGLNASSITKNTATLNWNSDAGASSYSYQYKIGNTWSSLQTTSNNSVNISGLNDLTTYQWRVKINCLYDTSNFVTDSFTTLSICGTNCCPPMFSNMLDLTTTSAKLSWSKVKGALTYLVEYKHTNSGTWISTTATTDTTIVLTGLDAGAYDWRVSTNCSGASSSYTVNSFTIYCGSAGASNESEFIREVKIGSYDRKSGGDGGYYFNPKPNINLIPGQQYAVTVAAGFTGVFRTDYLSLFLDFNNNGSYSDANELLAQKKIVDTTKATITFTLPSNASIGNSRMRVVLKWGSYASNCNMFRYGEVEDYLVNIIQGPENPNTPQTIANPKFLTIYPVPADRILNWYYPFSTEQMVKYAITNIEGKELVSKNYKIDKYFTNGQIDVSTLKNGIYFLNIASTEGHQVVKFMINR